MGLIDTFKKLAKPEGSTDKDGRYYGNIYKELGMIEPFTLLVAGQFNNFISEFKIIVIISGHVLNLLINFASESFLQILQYIQFCPIKNSVFSFSSKHSSK